MKMNKHREPPRALLTLVFVAVSFCILVITMAIVGLVVAWLTQSGRLGAIGMPDIRIPLITIGVASIAVGTAVAAILGGIPIKPLAALIDGMNRLAHGDFKARINLGRPPMIQEVSASFNTLAEELEHTEMLRSDFINNFSHEFKTPIVSIQGFAGLLLKGNLPEAQQREYLEIIAEESARLASMATGVLDLTKVENQHILTGTSRYNLSEQLRGCILLFEKRWADKGLTINAEFEEHMITANEEQLKQVWVNLLDNAVKFSPERGEIDITIAQAKGVTAVSIQNRGDALNEAEQERIFQKFYQGDTSHASEGTGIGLAIVKKIVELHRGAVSASNANDKTVFTVTLPDVR